MSQQQHDCAQREDNIIVAGVSSLSIYNCGARRSARAHPGFTLNNIASLYLRESGGRRLIFICGRADFERISSIYGRANGCGCIARLTNFSAAPEIYNGAAWNNEPAFALGEHTFNSAPPPYFIFCLCARPYVYASALCASAVHTCIISSLFILSGWPALHLSKLTSWFNSNWRITRQRRRRRRADQFHERTLIVVWPAKKFGPWKSGTLARLLSGDADLHFMCAGQFSTFAQFYCVALGHCKIIMSPFSVKSL